jgi:hypothetical protein
LIAILVRLPGVVFYATKGQSLSKLLGSTEGEQKQAVEKLNNTYRKIYQEGLVKLLTIDGQPSTKKLASIRWAVKKQARKTDDQLVEELMVKINDGAKEDSLLSPASLDALNDTRLWG